MAKGFENEGSARPSISGCFLDAGVRFGPYVLTRKIGYGGMAEVFLGRKVDEGSDSDLYVLKCILPHLADKAQYLAMFINEAQLAAQMDHPGIVKVFDFGEFEGRLYMAMEFVDGLDCWRFARRLFPWGKHHSLLAIWVICRVLEALHYAHQMRDVNGRLLNVVHRDLSPSNIYLSTEGAVKLGDFGIARIDSERYRKITMIPSGKFGYVAPEQVEGHEVTHRADIFSAGVVLAELLIGEKMFIGKNQLSVMMEIKDARLNNLDKNMDRLDQPLLDMLRRALSRRPEDRYPNALEFQKDLERYLAENAFSLGRDELGFQVCRAVHLNEGIKSENPGEHSPTPKALELTPRGPSGIPPAQCSSPSTPFTSPCPGAEDVTPMGEIGASPSWSEPPFRGTPITAESTPFDREITYRAKLADGRSVGPFTYSRVVELIYSDQIGPETLVSGGGNRFAPASDFPEINRHFPTLTPTWEFQLSRPPDRKGVFVMEAPGVVLLSLAFHRESGIFACRHAQKRKEVFFHEGQPVHVASNRSEELLGEFLVAQRAIKRAELDLALALLPKFNGHLGDTLIALGLISASELFQQIKRQMTARFVELLSWKSGFYEFYRGVKCCSDVMEVPLDPFATISETLLRSGAEFVSQTTLDKLGPCTIVPSIRSQELLGKLNLPDAISMLLLDTFGPTRVSELGQCGGDAAELHNLMLALFFALETGIWVIEGGVPPWRPTTTHSA